MNWRVFLTSTAEKQFRRLPRKAAIRISQVIDEIGINPLGGDVVKLEGKG